jgi:hypothetical protein
VEALRLCWEASGGICSKRLAPFLPELVANLERHRTLALTPAIRTQVVGMRPSTIDRLLRPYRLALKPRAGGHPPTLAHIRARVPIRTHDEWNDAPVGSLQADLVEHCGEDASGSFLYTLTVVDIATGWTECCPIRHKTMGGVAAALHRIRTELPMELCALHTDNGSEFVNEQLTRYCNEEHIRFTRGRPYRKNDQAFVEQRNWTAVRESVGYGRYSSNAALAALEELYRQQHFFLNFFQPIRKLVGKERHGAKVTKRYDEAATPFERLLASGTLSASKAKKLTQLFRALDVAMLHRNVVEARRDLLKHKEPARRTIPTQGRKATDPSPSTTPGSEPGASLSR